jgi:hypothetical protein
VHQGRITARMPVQDERRALDIPEGIPPLVVNTGDRTELLPADRTVIEVAGT